MSDDTDVIFIYYHSPVLLFPVIRTKTEMFTQTAVDASRDHHLEVVVNAEQYETDSPIPHFYGTDGERGKPESPSFSKPIGEVVISGRVWAGRSSPDTFYVAETVRKGKISYKFAKGDPPVDSTTAFGGGVPVIIGGLKYGSENKYADGVKGPPAGDPGSFAAQMTQRSNKGYAALDAFPKTSGKVLIAHSRSGTLVVVVQADGAEKGMSLTDIRDRLAAESFDDAVAFDGSSSATLVVNGKVKVQPAKKKDATIDVGIGIKKIGGGIGARKN